ncbi:MAG: Fur family transcriptional regulator [Ferrimicrobium sp.]
MEDDPRVAHALAKLRGAGGRITTPRRLIVANLVAAGGHLSADEISTRVHTQDPKIHLTTIYRTVEALERLGVVNHIHLGHGRAVYHLADDSHYHLFCQHCGQVEEIDIALLEPFEAIIAATYGFTPLLSHFAILGICRRCQLESAPASSLVVNHQRPTQHQDLNLT